ncbi:phage tail fiber domain-containing protein [Pseudomonas xantholysinigenes]|uniref:Pectate lyase superfamily protein domain-containing protein n=1 Tax=Pseudomonas xantholysinigenes TaxID=2745490 RepID=A0A9E6Q0E1_9PSED|nr:phage tail fiber protein [Pseudomonas xantholysinigenes]QXI40444.1 hypothetical protein HU772_010370 [Pseudomonas xantholysinigenes]
MAVPAGPTEKSYEGNGVATVFTVPFLVIQATDLAVYVDGTRLTSGYTLSGVGNPSSTVTFSSAPAPLAQIIFQLDVPFERLNDYQENGDFQAETVNRDYDRIWQALKQLLRYFGRALTLAPFDIDGTGRFLARGNRIVNLADPVDQQDAVTRKWVGDYLDQVSGNVNTTVGITYNGDSLYNYLMLGVSRTVNSIASLRALQRIRNQRAFVLGYYSALDGGGGTYYADLSDTSSADNGGTIIVGADGTRWKLKVEGSIDVKQFGARPDDETGAGTDSYAAIQAAINWAVQSKTTRVTAVGKFRTSNTIVMNTGVFMQTLVLDGCGQNSRIRCTGADKDVIQFSTTQFMRMGGVRDIEIQAGATAGHGVNIVYGAQQCQFINVTVTALNPVKNCWRGVWSAFAVGEGGCFDCIWDGGDLYVTTSHTTYGIYFLTNGTCFNENQFRGMRWNQATNTYFAYVGNVHSTSYLVNNHFKGINFEICKGGGLLMYCGRGTIFEGLSYWDAGTYSNHLLHFPNVPGLRMTGTVIRGFQRNGDTLAVGVRDIFIEIADETTISGLTGGSSYDWGGNLVVIEGPKLALGIELNYGNRVYANHKTLSICAGEITGSTGAGIWAENVATIVRLSAGKYRITFIAQSRADVNYTVDAGISGTPAFFSPAIDKQLTYFDLTYTRFDGAAADPTTIMFRMIG